MLFQSPIRVWFNFWRTRFVIEQSKHLCFSFVENSCYRKIGVLKCVCSEALLRLEDTVQLVTHVVKTDKFDSLRQK